MLCSLGLSWRKSVVTSESSKTYFPFFLKCTARISLTNPGESPPPDSIWKASDIVQESSSLFPINSLLHSQIHSLFLLMELNFSQKPPHQPWPEIWQNGMGGQTYISNFKQTKLAPRQITTSSGFPSAIIYLSLLPAFYHVIFVWSHSAMDSFPHNSTAESKNSMEFIDADFSEDALLWRKTLCILWIFNEVIPGIPLAASHTHTQPLRHWEGLNTPTPMFIQTVQHSWWTPISSLLSSLNSQT